MNKLDKILSAVFPNVCCGCDSLIYGDEEICPDCRDIRVHFRNSPEYCKSCGQSKTGCVCHGSNFFDKSAFAFYYREPTKEPIWKFKFRGKLFYGKLFARQMLQVANESRITKDAAYIVPVPMHPFKKMKRGYNQTEVLAKSFSRMSGIPYLKALKMLNITSTQHKLGPLYRIGNVAGNFEVRRKYAEKIDGARIILVDDIMTTHATLNEAAKTLLIFGADNVDVVSIAAAKRKKPEAQSLKKE